MPPSRRQSRATPPTRRPRVAGLRRPNSPQRTEPDPGGVDDLDEPETGERTPEPPATVRGSVIGAPDPATLEPDAVQPEDAGPTDAEPANAGPADVQPEDAGPTDAEPANAGPADVQPEDARPTDTEPAGTNEPAEEPPMAPERPRPAGKRRSKGITQPGDLAEAEAEVADAPPEPARTRRASALSVAIVLVLVAVLLSALAVWFRGEAKRRSDAADVNNAALIDPARAGEATEQLRGAIEKTLSFNYTDLDSTAAAVRDNLAGKASCEYEQLFGEVRRLAPEQKLVVTAQVREIGLTRLEDDKAMLLVFVDQRSTRTDQNQTAVSGAQFTINAERQGDRWKITGFDLLRQPLAGGKAAPQC